MHPPASRGLAPLMLCAALSSACASGSSAQATPSSGSASPASSAGVPGFDTREYPGDAVMARWREQSPYRWVGYYLPAPCHTGSSWQGRRDALETMGWGIAVLFIGEQAWAPGDEPPPDRVPVRCTRANVTAERGAADGRDASAAARAEGFPARTVLFLDVERADGVPAEQAAYAAAWARAVRAGGFAPGLYAHARNAAALRSAMSEAAPGSVVALWVAAESGFDLTRAPAASGFADAAVWQGAFDHTESWGDARLRIDQNVATSTSPSAPR